MGEEEGVEGCVEWGGETAGMCFVVFKAALRYWKLEDLVKIV